MLERRGGGGGFPVSFSYIGLFPILLSRPSARILRLIKELEDLRQINTSLEVGYGGGEGGGGRIACRSQQQK